MKTRKLFTLALCLALSLGCFGCGDNSGRPDPDKNYKITVQKGDVTLLSDADEYKSASIAATVSEADGTAVDGAKITYASENTQVATVSGTGVVTAVGEGQTTITLTFGNASASVNVGVRSSITAEQINTFGEQYVKQWGRVFTEGGKLNVHHVASGFEITFIGTSLTADIEVTKTRKVEDQYFESARARVFVDGDKEGIFTKLETKKGLVLVKDLPEGIHTVRVLKANELIDSLYTVSNLSADGFATPPQKADLKLEFIGDSITAGFGVFGKQGDTRDMDNSDGCKTYAYLTAQELGADLTMVAESGICVKVTVGDPNDHKMADIYPLLTPYAEQPIEYDFNDGVDVVVLNLGSNDQSYMDQSYENSLYSKVFPSDYEALLSFIRSKRPDAYILCVYGTVTQDSRIDRGITTAIKNLNDEKIIRFTKITSNNEGAAYHPNFASQKKTAASLATYIKELFK